MTAFRPLALLTFFYVGLASASPQVLPTTPGMNEYKTGAYTLKLMNNDTVGQMWEGQRVLGTVYTVNGQMLFMPIVPEPEASKAKKAFEDWKASGKTGSQAPPRQPVSFEPDGGATVPLQDGSIAHFASTYVEIMEGNALATIPGQPPVKVFKVELPSPSVGGAVFKGSTKIYINNDEMKPRPFTLFGGNYAGGRKAVKLNTYYKQLMDGPMRTAAEIALADPKKPANALDYMEQIKKVDKRIDESF